MKALGCLLVVILAGGALLGCGSGSDGSTSLLEDDLTMAQADIESLQTMLDAAQAELKTSMATVTERETTISTLQSTISSLRVQLSSAQTQATADAKRTTELTALLTNALAALGTAREDLADAQDDLDDAEAAVAALEEEEEEEEETTAATPPTPATPTTPATPPAEDVRRAHKIREAIEVSMAPPPFAFNTLSGTATDDPRITAEKGIVKIEADNFTLRGSASGPTGFTGVVLEDDAPATPGIDVATWRIHSNIEARRGRLEHHHNDKQVPYEPSDFMIDTVDIANVMWQPPGATTMLDIFTMSGIQATRNGKRIVTLAPDAMNGILVTITKNFGERISATFMGVSGGFECRDAGGCTFVINLDTYVMGDPRVLAPTTPFVFTPRDESAGTGEWLFKAGSQPQIVVPGGDQQYAYYGWWIERPDSADGAYQFEPRVGGKDLVDFSSALFATSRTYRYVGSATGWYVQEDRSKTVESDGDFLTQASSGIFSATASLEATSTAGVKGVIDNFREGGASLGDWEVVLEPINSGAAAATNLTVGDTPSTGAGNWNVRFEHSRVGATSTMGVGNDEAPVAAVGYFDAKLAEVLTLSGAFGANRQ